MSNHFDKSLGVGPHTLQVASTGEGEGEGTPKPAVANEPVEVSVTFVDKSSTDLALLNSPYTIAPRSPITPAIVTKAFHKLSSIVKERKARRASLQHLNGVRNYFETLKENLRALFEFDVEAATAYTHLSMQASSYVDQFTNAVTKSEAREQQVIYEVFSKWLGLPDQITVTVPESADQVLNCWGFEAGPTDKVYLHILCIVDLGVDFKSEDSHFEGVLLASHKSSTHPTISACFSMSLDSLTVDLTPRALYSFYANTGNSANL